jgi:hypothetical protein
MKQQSCVKCFVVGFENLVWKGGGGGPGLIIPLTISTLIGKPLKPIKVNANFSLVCTKHMSGELVYC